MLCRLITRRCWSVADYRCIAAAVFIGIVAQKNSRIIPREFLWARAAGSLRFGKQREEPAVSKDSGWLGVKRKKGEKRRRGGGKEDDRTQKESSEIKNDHGDEGRHFIILRSFARYIYLSLFRSSHFISSFLRSLNDRSRIFDRTDRLYTNAYRDFENCNCEYGRTKSFFSVYFQLINPFEHLILRLIVRWISREKQEKLCWKITYKINCLVKNLYYR